MEGQVTGLSSLVWSTWKDLNLPGRRAWELGLYWDGKTYLLWLVPFSTWNAGLYKWKREGDQQGAFIAACFLIVNARCQLLQVSAGLTALALETILLNGEPGLPSLSWSGSSQNILSPSQERNQASANIDSLCNLFAVLCRYWSAHVLFVVSQLIWIPLIEHLPWSRHPTIVIPREQNLC